MLADHPDVHLVIGFRPTISGTVDVDGHAWLLVQGLKHEVGSAPDGAAGEYSQTLVVDFSRRIGGGDGHEPD